MLAYMGTGEAPPIPKIPFLLADAACNFVQANDIDPSHLSFLHLLFDSKLVNGPSNQYNSQGLLTRGRCVKKRPLGCVRIPYAR